MPLPSFLDFGPSRKKNGRRGRRPRFRHANHRRRAILQSLEDRRLLASFEVVTLGDAGTGTCSVAQCTLRDAVLAANASAGADTITFDPSVVGRIELLPAGGEILISGPLEIDGPGASILTVEAKANPANEFRIFNANENAGDVTIRGLTLTGGRVSLEGGGAIQFESRNTLTIRDSVITGNEANNGGAIYSKNDGSIAIVSSTVSDNEALFGSGGGIQNVDGSITVTSSVVTGNRSDSSGAGIFSNYEGSITITDSQITDNHVDANGYSGGGIYSSEGLITITGSTVSGNSAAVDGGGIYSYNGIFTISDSTLENNRAGDSGGGIFNYAGALDIDNSTINNNTADNFYGGGISNNKGAITLTNTTISNNRASNDGGGIANSSGRVNVISSLFDGNRSDVDGGGIATVTGGVTLINSTVSGNEAGARGAGIQSDSAAVRLVNATVTLNVVDPVAGSVGGGIAFIDNNDGESLLSHNSIVANNTATRGPDFLAPGNAAANLEVRSSLIGNNDATSLAEAQTVDANGNLVGSPGNTINPSLLALAENGGPTRSHNPFFGSPAIDRGDDALALDLGADGAPGGGDDTPLISDQRGGLFLRTVGSSTDMGAVEQQFRPLLIVDTDADVVNGDFSPGDRSLRELIEIANRSAGAESILFSIATPITLDPALGPLVITDPLQINGNGAQQTTIQKDPAEEFRLINVTSSAGNVRISNLTLTGGNAGNADGGAIHSRSSGDLVLVKTDISGNTAASGGGVAATSGTVAIAASVLSGNTAGVNGGAVAVSGAASALTLVDATISTNSAGNSGGGIFSENTPVEIKNSTITANSASTTSGGVGLLANGGGESLDIENSIIAGNMSPVSPDFNAPMNPGPSLSVNFSLIGSNEGTSLPAAQPDANGNLIGDAATPLDPLLGPLADNGGPTRTHAPLDLSPAIDSGGGTLPSDTYDVDGNNNTLETLPVDQRGADRVFNSVVDMGAVELAAIPVVNWNNPADITFGTLLTDAQLNASSPVPGSFAYTPNFGDQLPVGKNQILSTVFTPSNLLLFRAATASVSINVLAIPVIESDGGGDTAAVDVPENTVDVTDVESTDADGDSEGAGLTYTLTGGADQSLFTIDPNNGVLTFISAPDFETPGDVGGDNVYDVQVTVTDSDDLSDVQDIAVTVTNVNEDPTITSSAVASAAENQTLVIDVDSTDDSDEEGAGLGYSISGGADQALFSINANTGVLRFISAPDFENAVDAGGDNVYDVQVTVTDSGDLTDVQDIAVTVTDVNESPTITSSASADAPENQTFAIDVESSDDSDSEGAGLSYAITGGADQGLFSIDLDTGELTFNDPPDFEMPGDAGGNNVYNVQVTVTDSGDLVDVQDFAVTVTDVNEAPTITSPAATTAPENQTFAIDVESSDDADTEGAGLVYSISGGADESLFSIDASTGVLTFNTAPDFDNPGDSGADNVYDVQVTVTDSGDLTDVQDIAVTVIDTAALDFGDAPAAFPVLLGQDGARHVLGPLRLGATVDTESDGQPSADANGDGADEDGVTVIAGAVSALAAETTSSFLVTASAPALLDAWIDFDGDQQWEPSEQIASNVSLAAGANVLSYPVPSSADPGGAAARFRLSSAGNLLPTGEASDGEVEDYIVTILDGGMTPNVTVNLPGGVATVSLDAGDVVVSDAQTTLFRAPEVEVGQLEVIGTPADDMVTIDLDTDPAPSAALLATAGGLALDGLAGSNTLLITGASVDFTGNVAAANFQSVDATDANPNTITLDAAAVAAMSPTTKTLSVAIGDFDQIEFADAGDWLLVEGKVVDNDFVRVAENQVTGEFVELSGPSDWQNFLDPSDIDGEGGPTAGDALLIINELGRRLFSDPVTEALVDAATVDPWPGRYYDQNGDGDATALDALRVINRLTELQSGESAGEWVVDQSLRTLTTLDTAESPATPVPQSPPVAEKVSSVEFTFAAAAEEDSKFAESSEPESSWGDRVDEFLASGDSLSDWM